MIVGLGVAWVSMGPYVVHVDYTDLHVRVKALLLDCMCVLVAGLGCFAESAESQGWCICEKSLFGSSMPEHLVCVEQCSSAKGEL